MSFARESFKNTLILKILVSMDRAQSGELGTLYFCSQCRCRMYISYFFHSEDAKMANMAKIANLSMTIFRFGVSSDRHPKIFPVKI